MWRFVLISFVFLGWAFFVMSGGADYRPAENSLQARAASERQHDRERLPRVDQSEPAERTLRPVAEETQRITSVEGLGAAQHPFKMVSATALSANREVTVPFVSVRKPEPVTPVVQQPEDRRRVAGGVVNLRTGPGTQFGRVGQVLRDTEVVVLRDPGAGWVKLRVPESGRIGWMAERLLVAAN